MNLKFWKHKDKKEVIGQSSYEKLPTSHRSMYMPTYEEPTHEVKQDDSGDFLTSMIIGSEIGSLMSDDSSSFDSSSVSDSGSSFGDSGGFGGGDFGGGGASGDF